MNQAKINEAECQDHASAWRVTREAFISWSAKWADESGIKDVLQWRGFPLWWSSHLVHRDIYTDNDWYLELHNRLCGFPAKKLKSRSDTEVVLKILKNLIKDLGNWCLMCLLPKEPKRIDKKQIYFHSLEYNLISSQDGFCDRMYSQAPLHDVKSKYKTAFIVKLFTKWTDFMQPWVWKNKISQYSAKLERHVEILDKHMSLLDVIEIHLSLIKNYFYFKKFIRPFAAQGVKIKNAEIYDILFHQMQKSFYTILPWSLGYAAMFSRLFNNHGVAKTLITYGDTLAEMRPVYYLTSKHSPKHRWISIQHSTMSKNKIGLYNRFSEFHKTEFQIKQISSPMMDYYFAQGSQFAKILSEFYPAERIRIIGCLKYDHLHKKRYRRQASTLRKIGGRTLLLAPSVGDEESILKMFTGLNTIPNWRIVWSKHPAVSKKKINQLLQKLKINLKIAYNSNISTIQLIRNADVVICGFSSIALESLILGVPSVRVLSRDLPPIVEDEHGIRYIYTQKELLKIFSDFQNKKMLVNTKNKVADTIQRFFYKIDGNASKRFWTELSKITDLPCNSNIQN